MARFSNSVRAALAAVTLLAGGVAFAQAPGAPPPEPRIQDRIPQTARAAAAPKPDAPLPPPRRFVTKRAITVGGKPLPYTAIAGEIYLSNRAGEPIGSIFSFSYLKDGPREPRRPVMFVFNGGPGSSSVWLHMGVVGPRRVVLDQEVNPASVPPFGLVDNPYTVLDVADLVFIDPVGTGWSRPIGVGTTADFWGVEQDAESVAQFIELWLTEHGRWNAPKFVMGESYGSIRAAILPRALMGSPIYGGVMRGITLNGIVLLGTTLDARDPGGDASRDLRAALRLPAAADAAWFHQRIDRRGRTLEAYHQEAVAFARGDYADAIRQEKAGQLSAETRAATVARLTAFTGLPADAFAASIEIPRDFSRRLMADRGLDIGVYDSRYTLPLAGSGLDPVADDAAMGRYVPGFVSAFHQMLADDLKVDMGRPYGAIVWRDLLPQWDWKRQGGVPQDQSYARDLAIGMRRNPALQVLVASGYYDLATDSATAEFSVEQAALPMDRVTLRRYASGHMLYLGDTAGAFAADVRALIQRASR